MQLLDFSAALIEPAAIRAAGYGGVIGYFSESRPGTSFGAKPLRRDYCDRLRAAGLEIVTNYQYGKGETADWRGGYDAGCRHAEIALRLHFEAGGPGYRPLYAPVDDNPTLQEWNAMIAPFLRGWASVVGLEWTGMYGNARCIDWALEDDVARWFWQHNFSGDRSINGDHPAAHLHQIEIDKRKIGGVGVDVNTVLKDDYGQWSAARPIGDTVPEFREIDETDVTPNRSGRGGAVPIWFLLHTQEGNGTAQSLAGYLQNPNSQVSYHYTIDNDEVVDVVDTDLASWSVLDANPRSINLCFAGSRAGWSRQQWLDNLGPAIDTAAFLAVRNCHRYGIPARVINPEELGRGEAGIADHYAITAGLGIGTHTDVGDGFPWDIFSAAVAKYAGTQPNGATMALLEEKFTNWQGREVTVRTALKYMDQYLGLVLDQLVGPGARERGGEPTRWAELGGRTVVEALAIIGETLDIEGFGMPGEKVHAKVVAPVAQADAAGITPEGGQQ